MKFRFMVPGALFYIILKIINFLILVDYSLVYAFAAVLIIFFFAISLITFLYCSKIHQISEIPKTSKTNETTFDKMQPKNNLSYFS